MLKWLPLLGITLAVLILARYTGMSLVDAVLLWLAFDIMITPSSTLKRLSNHVSN